jgi:hypothetical protein
MVIYIYIYIYIYVYIYILSRIPGMCGSVTNNSTRVRIGYRIYSLWRFITATGYNYNEHYSTDSFSGPTDGTALRRRLTSRTEYFLLRRLTDDDDSLTHWRGLTRSASND